MKSMRDNGVLHVSTGHSNIKMSLYMSINIAAKIPYRKHNHQRRAMIVEFLVYTKNSVSLNPARATQI